MTTTTNMTNFDAQVLEAFHAQTGYNYTVKNTRADYLDEYGTEYTLVPASEIDNWIAEMYAINDNPCEEEDVERERDEMPYILIGTEIFYYISRA